MMKLITVFLIYILSGVEIDLFIPSFPEIQRIFKISPFEVQLILSINLIAYCVSCIFAGTLGDRFNKKRLIIISLSIFIFGSLLCVSATNFIMLLTGRLFQGIGMSGPVVFSYVLIADDYPIEKQPALLGILTGTVSVAMTIAPLIGSYISYYFKWRANFFVLLLLSIICLIMSFFNIKNTNENNNLSISLKTYISLLNSPKLISIVLTICLFATPYWVFIGMAPILYMQDLGVSLKNFGFYQGVISGTFSITNFLFSKLTNNFKKENCLCFGLIICTIGVTLIILITSFEIRNPSIITFSMLLVSIGSVFPINIFYPQSLMVLEKNKSKTIALLSFSRYLIIAVSLEVVSFLYQGSFLPIGIMVAVSITLGIFGVLKLQKKGWVTL